MQSSILNSNESSNALSIGHSQAIVENVTLNVEIVGNKTSVTAPFSFKYKPRKYALTSDFAKVVSKYAKFYGKQLASYDELLVKPNGIVYSVKFKSYRSILTPSLLEKVYNSLKNEEGNIINSLTEQEFNEIANSRGHILEASLGGKDRIEKVHLIWASFVFEILCNKTYPGHYVSLALLLERATTNYGTTPQEYAQHILATGVAEFVAKWSPVTPTPPTKPKANRKGANNMKYKAFKTLRGAEVFMAKNANKYQMELIFVENGYEVEYRPMRLVINWDKTSTKFEFMSRVIELQDGKEVRDVFSTKAILTLIETPQNVFIDELGETDGKYLFARLVQYLAKVNDEKVDLAYVKEFSYAHENPTPNSGASEVEQALNYINNKAKTEQQKQAFLKRQQDEDAINEELALIRANRGNRKEVA